MAVPNPYSTQQKKTQSNVPVPQSNVVPFPQSNATQASYSSVPRSNVPTPSNTPTMTATATPTIPRASVPMPPTTDYRSQVDTLLKQYQQMAAAPLVYNAQSDPSYASIQQAARRASQNTMEALNERGILNSTITASQIGQIQQQAEAQAEQAAYERAYNERLNQLSNLGNLINLYANRDDTMFGRGVTEGQLTGTYIPNQAQPLVQQLLALKQEAERPGLGAETYARYKEQGDALRAQLRAMGVDTSWIESNVTSAQAAQALPQVFSTLDARNQQFNQDMAQQELQMRQQQMEYQAARDAIADQRWKAEFDEDVRRWGLQYALNRQVQLGNLDISRYNAATSRMNAETNRMDAQRRTTDAEQSTNAQNFQATVLNEMRQFSSPSEAREWLNANAGEIARVLGTSGLNQMYQMVDTLYPQQVDPNTQNQARLQQLREQAVKMAQSDPNWQFSDSAKREQLISEYMRLLGG